jgi:hypothetical protein
MTNNYNAKIGRTVHHKVTIGGVTRWRPAVITAVTDADTATLRVGHHGETYAAVDRRTGADVKWYGGGVRTDLNKWRPG